ncbi:MAG: hypothetical protein H6564_12280 [Lewinellaceae bacterium]|nr:hypothetical protein [Lewinellaceae bacterium]
MQQRLSLYAWALCSLFLLATGLLYYPKWKMAQTEATISWDVSGYYFYLPAVFIYKDLKQVSFRETIHEKYHPASSPYQAFEHPSGHYVMKYSAGMAVQYLPFFLAAHVLAKPFGYEADGFSRPYQLAIGLGSLLVAMLGLWLLRNNLLVYFPDKAVAGVLLLLVFATNYLDYAAINGAMTHNYLFTLYALLVWLTIRFYQWPSWWKAAGIGLVLGLAALTRPTEVIAVLIPLLWGIPHMIALRERLAFFRQHWRLLLLAALACLAVGSIQLIYWKYVSGDWIVYSYQDQGFSWLAPHVKDGLLSFRAGWLVYTPSMLFALLGFFTLYRQHRPLFWPALAFSLVFMYITFAWDIWWYGGSLGQRAMVQAYAILAFPLASLIQWLLRQKRWLQYGFVALSLLFSYYNLWWTHQAHRGGLFASEQMTKPYFWRVLFRYDVPEEALKLLDTKYIHEGQRHGVQLIYENGFEADSSATGCPLPPISGQHSLCLGKEQQFSPVYDIPFQPEKRQWLRASATFRCQDKEWDTWRMTQFIVRFKQDDEKVKEHLIRVYRFLDTGQSRELYLDCKFPRKPFNHIEVAFWNADSDKPIAIDNLKIEVYE